MINSEINDLVKISIIGHPAVGKTTILKLLSENTIDKLYFPTQGFDLKTVNLENYNLRVWDFGGQTAYLNYLEEYLKGSDLIVVVSDSTPRNVLNTRKLIETADNIVGEECPIIAIANKQDLCKNDGRMERDMVENLLRVKTFGLSAIKPEERIKLTNIIKNELNHVLIRKRLKENEI